MEHMEEGNGNTGGGLGLDQGLRDSPPTKGSKAAGKLWGNLKSNLASNELWQELSGSAGDIGTFLPILLALALVNELDFGTTLIFTGIYNLITGALFGVPMPVQPMKSIAAVAITEGNPLTVSQIMAAGITTSSLILFLGATGLMTLVQRLVPLSIVRGIQLSQGISFGLTAVKYVEMNQNLETSKSTGHRGWTGSDGLLLAFSAFFFVILVTGVGGGGALKLSGPELDKKATSKKKDPESQSIADGLSPVILPEEEAVPQENNSLVSAWQTRVRVVAFIPTALIIFLVGVVIAIAKDTSVFKGWRWGPPTVHVVHISARDWRTGFVRAAIPQIPLSIFNSVIATCKLSRDLFPEKRFVTPRHISVSVGLMNLVGCWFGSMPVCHGCGGLAGQYRFGARSGLSVAFLGMGKLVVGLVFGSSLLRLLSNFPIGLLGVLLFFSGLELAMACRDQNTRLDAFVMLVVTFVSLGTSNLTKGFIIGVIVWVVLKINQLFIEARWPRRDDILA